MEDERKRGWSECSAAMASACVRAARRLRKGKLKGNILQDVGLSKRGGMRRRQWDAIFRWLCRGHKFRHWKIQSLHAMPAMSIPTPTPMQTSTPTQDNQRQYNSNSGSNSNRTEPPSPSTRGRFLYRNSVLDPCEFPRHYRHLPTRESPSTGLGCGVQHSRDGSVDPSNGILLVRRSSLVLVQQHSPSPALRTFGGSTQRHCQHINISHRRDSTLPHADFPHHPPSIHPTADVPPLNCGVQHSRNVTPVNALMAFFLLGAVPLSSSSFNSILRLPPALPKRPFRIRTLPGSTQRNDTEYIAPTVAGFNSFSRHAALSHPVSTHPTGDLSPPGSVVVAVCSTPGTSPAFHDLMAFFSLDAGPLSSFNRILPAPPGTPLPGRLDPYTSGDYREYTEYIRISHYIGTVRYDQEDGKDGIITLRYRQYLIAFYLGNSGMAWEGVM